MSNLIPKSGDQHVHHHPNPNINLNTVPPNSESQDPHTHPHAHAHPGSQSGPGTLSLSTSMTEGGYDYELLGGTELLDSRYECPICLLYLRDPVLTHCGHKFCFYCISQWIVKEGGRCPVDGAMLGLDSIFPDNFTRREILQCKAKCPYVKEGCSVILSLPELEKHVQLEHGVGGKQNSSNPSSPNNEMVSCMYKDVGCFTLVSREQLQKHLETEVHHHLQLITAAYKRLKSCRSSFDYHPRDYFYRQDSRDSTKWLLADDAATIDSDDYQFRRQRSWDSVRFARKQYVGPKYSDKLAESDESLGKLSESQTNSPHSSQSHNLNKGELACGASSEGLPGSNGSNGIELKNVCERLVRLEQIDREKQIKIDHLESRLSSALNLCSTLTQVMDDITARYCHGVFVWKIGGLKKLCSEMRRNPNRVLNSPGFYTDTFGYKLCLRFNLTTTMSMGEAGASGGAAAAAIMTPPLNTVEIPLEQDANTFISLYIHFMKGEYDDTLRWPFHGELKLSVVHPTLPESSISEVMRSKPDAAAFAKPTLARNIKGFGYAEFAPLNKIFTGGYVKDNTLTCKILAKAH